MGHGIAHAAITGGYRTRMYDVSDAAVASGRNAIEQIVKKGVELGKVTAADADAILGRLSTTTSLADAPKPTRQDSGRRESRAQDGP